jgi:uncharacterized phiE125 gp8 family phage protein
VDGTVVVVTPPAIEPLTLSEVRRHLNLGAGDSEPAPSAPTVALISPAVAGNVDNGAHRYLVTFVTADGETEAGAVSAAVTVVDKTANGKVTVSAIPLGGSTVTSRKLYRTVAGGTLYLLLATIADNTTTSYTDNIADSALGAGAPSTNTTEDPLLVAQLTAAREHVENLTGRALITQTLRCYLDRFPGCTAIKLPRPNLLTVTSVQYVDENGDTQTLSASDYTVDTAHLPGRILLNWDATWPSTLDQPNSVIVNYTAGYGPARSDVPGALRVAMKLLIGDMYQNREASIIGTIQTDNPTVAALLASYEFKEAA